MKFSTRQRRFLDRVLAEVEPAGPNSLTIDELAASFQIPFQAVREIVRLGVLSGELLDLDGMLMTPGSLQGVANALCQRFGGDPFTAAEARDLFRSNRRVIEKVLERLDAEDKTVRVEGGRIIRE
jgi:hypothetical protein